MLNRVQTIMFVDIKLSNVMSNIAIQKITNLDNGLLLSTIWQYNKTHKHQRFGLLIY